jgi:tetratricopeptide (TPR) repeat protein
MNALQRGLLIGAIVLLGIGELVWSARSAMLRAHHDAELAQAKQAAPRPLPPAHRFTRAEGYAFLAAARKAEAIADPLQRCLAYPDPPGSHWSRDAVVAYCHLQMQPAMTFAEARKLIQEGKAAELDRRLAAVLHAQQTDPLSHGLLDRIYSLDFDNSSFDIRPTLDAWKRDSPHSAFAWAASGMAYVAMASHARGGAYMQETPPEQIEAMDRLLAQADGDLRHAIALDPAVTPAHRALIDAGRMGFGEAYTSAAIRAGLAAAPDNYSIYMAAMWAREPKWGGSLEAMDELAAQARTQAAANPLLKLLLAERAYYEVANCDCTVAAALAAYPSVFDQVTNKGYLAHAGTVANDHHDMAVAGIYLSEVLRFDTGRSERRIRRSRALVDFDEAAWAVADLGRVLAASPHDAKALTARAFAYEAQSDFARAEQDYRAVLALHPGDAGTLLRLGDLFINLAHDWDKGWAVADQLIREQPNSPNGWLMRANIQQQQPRAGLDATADELDARFGKNPQMARIILDMRASVALRRHTGIDAAHSPP